MVFGGGLILGLCGLWFAYEIAAGVTVTFFKNEYFRRLVCIIVGVPMGIAMLLSVGGADPGLMFAGAFMFGIPIAFGLVVIRAICPKGDHDEEIEDPRTDDFVAVRERIDREYVEIEHAMRTYPSDPALLQRIEKLTEEVGRIDRRVVARLPFHELVAGRPPKHPTRHYPEDDA
jgi:hypothetical protein